MEACCGETPMMEHIDNQRRIHEFHNARYDKQQTQCEPQDHDAIRGPDIKFSIDKHLVYTKDQRSL